MIPKRNVLLVVTAFGLGCGANVLVVDPVERGSDGGAGASGASTGSGLPSARSAAAPQASREAARAPTSPASVTVAPTPAAGEGMTLFRQAAEYETGASPQAIAVADFNGDGALDIAVGDGLGGDMSVLFNRGDGTFSAPIAVGAQGSSAVIAAGDFDGDGLPDLAGTGPEGLVVIRNLGCGEFAPPTKPYALKSPAWIAAGDFDGDGRDELLVTNYTGDAENIAVYECPFDRPTAPPVLYASAPGPWFAAVRDVDGDGSPDVVVASSGLNQAAGTVSVLRNTGYGFAAPESYAAGFQPSALVIDDLDHDGRADIVARSVGGVFGLEGRAGARFAPSIYEPMMDGSLAIATGDVDGDGDEDIVTASDSKLVLLHDPLKRAVGKVDEYPVGATAIALGDFDDDGKLDLVAVGSVVRVLLHAH